MLTNSFKLKRIQKQQQKIAKEPIQGILVKRQGDRNFHFVIYNLQHPYKDGYYHGLLELHENYPFAAPKLFFMTKSGRFQVNIPICTSFTNYHQQSWSSGWNIRTLLMATVSFMTSQQASYGCRKDPETLRLKYARESLNQNLKDQKFCQLFLEDLKKIGAPIPQNCRTQQSLRTEQLALNNLQNMLENNEQLAQDHPKQEQLLPKMPENPEEQRARNRRKVFWLIAIFIIVILIIIVAFR